MNLKRITLDDTVEETVNKINENSTDIEENVSRLDADFITHKDNITLKTSKIEKELNDYKATMQQINIHQSPTQKASGYGVVSLPKNAAEGQFSDVRVLGNTVFNHADNGVDYVNWTVTGAGSTKGANGIHLVADGTNERAVLPINLKPSTIYTLVVRIINCTLNDHWVLHNTGVSESVHTIPKTAGIHKIKFVTPSVITSNFLILLTLTANTDGTYVDFTDVMVFEGDYTTNSLPVNGYISYGTKSTIGAMRLKSVSEDESEVSTAYVVAKDEQGKIAELRSLPNGVKDEISLANGKMIKRVGRSKDFSDVVWYEDSAYHTENFYGMYARFADLNVDLGGKMLAFLSHHIINYPGVGGTGADMSITDNYFYRNNHLQSLFLKLPKSAYADIWTLAETHAWFEQNQVTLIYQLATPVEIPVQVSGTLVGYPSGTVYLEPFVPDAGIYDGGISILHHDLPIKSIEKLSKVDFYTGVETELDVSEAVIASDRLSFTHPDLSEGDIVFFEYEYDVESTEGETEVEYYDSRYVIKDSVTDKFYKWNIVVANGQPSIELVEV